MKYSNTVEYNISTKLDSSGLTKLQSQIKQLENSMQQMSNRNIINEEQVKSAKTQLEGLNSALTNSFNSSLGILDLSKFRAELDKSGVSATGLQSAFSMMGAEGQAALNGLTTQIANFNGGMERTSSTIDKIFTTFSNTFRWGMVSSFFSQFMNAIHSSIDYVKDLDDSLTQIMLVTDYNRDSMNEFARSANEAAKAVSMTTTGMTNASLIFAQQGYDLNQSQELATLSAKVANASQQDTTTTSDQITAYMNAYGLENNISELTQAMDNWALIANISAADVGELAQASQRAASMANAVGVSGEQLASQIATIESVTREAPEQIGNGLKTLYARFSDIASGKEDEDGFTLGKVTSELNKIGVQVLDEMGQIRDVGDIMEDLMVIWDDLDQTSKVAASQALAGKYQVNRFMALMDNSDMYEEYKGATGENAAGTLDMMNEEYADSIAGRSAKMQASLEGLFSTIFNTDDIYPWMDAAQGAVDLLQQFFDALGGGKTVLLGIISLLGQAFSQNMARSINDMIANQNLGKIREQNVNGVNDTLDRVGIDRTQGVGAYISATADQTKLGALNDAQYDTYMNNVQQWADASSALARSEEQLIDNVNAVNLVFGKIAGNTDAAKLTDKGLDTFGAADERAQWTSQKIAKKAQEVDFSDVSDQSRLVANTLKEVQEELQKSQEGFLDSQKTAESLEQTLDKLGDQLSVLSDEMQGYNSSAAEKMRENLENIREELKQSGEVSEGSAKQVQKYITEMEHLSNTAANMDETTARKIMNDAGDSAQQLQGNVNFNKIQEQRAAANAQESQAGIDYQQEIKGVLDTLNAVQQLAFAWQAFQSLGSLWANEDLSTGEKILQTIMNLTIALPQLINGLQNLQGMGGVLSKVGGVLLKPVEAIGNFTKEIDNIKEIADQGKIAKKALESVGEGLATTAKAGAVASQEMLKELTEASAAGDLATESFMGMNGVIGQAMAEAAATGAGGLGVLGAAAKAALIEFWPFLLIGGIIAAVGFAIGQEAEKAKQAKEDALEAFDEAQARLEEIQNLESQAESFKTKFETMKSEGEGFDGLVEDAEAFADALEEAGMIAESSAIRTAAYRAEVSGTTEDFEALAQEIENTQRAAEVQANNDNIEAAVEVLNTQKADYNEIINKQSELAELKRQFNELEADDPGRKVIQDKIDALQDYISKNKEAVDAVNAVRASQEAIAGARVDATQGGQLTMLGLDEATVRAGTEAKYTGARDTYTMDRVFGDQVQGWDSGIYTDLEKVDIMLNNVENDAERTSLKITDLLMESQGLTEFEGHNIGYQDQGQYVAGTSDYEAIMQQAGWTQDQALKFVASLDEPLSLEEFKKQVTDLNNQITDDTDLDVLLDARLSDESKDELVKDQVAAYQPKDEDVDSEEFQNLSSHFFENEDKMGVEGTPFEDYSEDLLGNAEALEEVVEGILRFNDAVESIDNNYNDWKEALSDTDDLAGQAAAIDDLQETYSDFLDLSEDMDVSEDFAANAENLDLMKAAAEGAEDAYEDLAMAAAEDILIHADVEDLDGAQKALEGLGAELPSLFEGVDIGGALDLSSVEDQINALAEATGWSADQMAAYLNSIGIKINPDQFQPLADSANATAEEIGQAAQTAADSASMDVEANQVTNVNTSTDQKDFTDAYPHVNPQGAQWSIDLPTFSGELANGVTPSTNTVTGWVPEITYTATPKSAKETKTDTSQATGYKYTAGKGATGKVKLKPNANATRSGGGSRPSGGAKPSGGGGGGGGKGKSCFVAGTLVTTLTGFSPIEQIKQGDIILSYNKLLHQLEYSKVVQTMIHDVVEPIYTLYVKNEQLRVTGIHRFLVSHDIFHLNPQWISAADLQIGDWMFLADGTWHLIHNIEVNVEHQIVYNFEVAGNHNYYVGRNQILAHNKGGGGKGGKGGKGGGGGGKAKTIENKEKKEHKKDYYEEVNTQLEKTEKILSKIEKEEDRLIGDKARANQNKQLGLLQKEIELNKEKQKIQQQELKDVDELMKKRAKEARKLAIKNGITAIIPSPIYDEDGAIANYEEMSAAIDKIHNQFIDQYNAAAKAGNEELTKEIQKTLEKFDKYGEDLLKNAQRHDKLQSEIEETINTLEELEDSIEDIRIDAFKAHQEAQDDLKDLKEDAAELASIFRDFNDDGFLTDWSLDDTPIDDMIKAMYELDDIYSVTQEDANKFYQDLIDKKEEALKNTTDKDEIAAIQSAIQYFQEQQANLGPDNLQNGLLGLANQDLDKLKGWIDGTNTEFNPFGENTAALWDAYEDAYKRATDLFKDWRETVQDLRDSIIDTYDEQEDAINNNIDEYDRLLDHLERIGDTYALYYGEDSYDNILTIMDRQGATMQQQLDDLTAAFNYWEQRYQEAIANGDEKLIQEIREKMEDAEDAMYDKAEELAEHWIDRYEKAVDASIQKIDIKLWGGGPGQTDLEDQSTIWELQKDYMNTYKDDVEKAYEIDKLRSKYIDLLNDAQGISLGTQNRIRKQMEDQLKLLENQNTVSEYDVKLANAKLEVLQKQMALEDAQRNKNKMQLRRDTQGNYRYVYRADEGNVKQAQDELAESEFDAYEMTKEQTIANNDRAISLYQDYMNKMRDIANKYQDDEVARNAALLALKEEYGKLLGALGEDFQNTTDGMYDVLTWLVKNGTEDTTTAAKDMMDQLYENAHKVKENTGNDWRDLATQITKDVLPNIQTAVEQGIGDIDTEATNLSKNLVGDNGVLNKIKSSTKMLEQGMMDATDTTEKWAKATRDLFESFSPDNKKVQEAMTQLKQMEEQLSANQQATSALSTKYKQANSALQAKTAEAEHYKTALDFSTGAKQVKTGTVVKLKKGTAVHYSRNNSQTDKQGHYGWSLPYDMWVKFWEIDKGQPNPYSFYATGDSLKQFGPIQNQDKSDNRGGEADTDKRHHQAWWFNQSELQKNVLAAMDTGGYTGSWNDNTSLYKNGKIAMLHQKELVLNATDTQNILTAVSLMRDMIAGSTNGLFNMNGLKNNISSSYNPVTEQRVEIQASFPNATDADDIRRALINLSDNAYQYSYRTR